MTQFFNRKTLKYYRRQNKLNSTPAELKLWRQLRSRRLMNYRFVRQFSIGMYILDFYCPQAKLGIELDGSHHKEPEIHALDLQKEEYIKSFGITVIRFDNVEVLKDLESVLVTITNYLK